MRSCENPEALNVKPRFLGSRDPSFVGLVMCLEQWFSNRCQLAH